MEVLAVRHDIIVIGASAGGIQALQVLVAVLPGDLPAALFIVLHIPASEPSRGMTTIADFLGHFLSKTCLCSARKKGVSPYE
jgi:chemotaxis response regulator CheB